MPRYSLRTLVVVMLLGGPLLAAAWWNRAILPFVVFVIAVFTAFQLGLMHSVAAFVNGRPVLPEGHRGRVALAVVCLLLVIVTWLFLPRVQQ